MVAAKKKRRSIVQDLQCEYKVVRCYYETTVWNVAKDFPLSGAEFDIAILAFLRLRTAQNRLLESLTGDEASQASLAGGNLVNIRPRPFEKDPLITPALLATLAVGLLAKQKFKSNQHAIIEAHHILVGAISYVDSLQDPRDDILTFTDALVLKRVSFEEILESLGKPDRVPLLPTVQKKRNGGVLTLRAVEMAIERFSAEAWPGDKRELLDSLKTRTISCKLLEEIRWNRFQSHYHQ